MMAMKTAPGSVMRFRIFAQVALGLRTGPDAGDEATLLADLVGLLRRVEGDRVVEVGEADDQQAVQDEVHGVRRVEDVVVDEAAWQPLPSVGTTFDEQRRQVAGSSWRR